MQKKPAHIEQFEELKNFPIKKNKFLKKFRTELELYMLRNPVQQEQIEKRSLRASMLFSSINEFLFGLSKRKIIAACLVIVALSAGGAAMASQNSLPGEPLYPIKILTENIRSSVTFSPDSKAKLEISFAGERIKEIKKIMDDRGVDEQKLTTALAIMKDDTKKARNVLEKEKLKGNDVSEMAKEINKNIDEHNKNMEQAFDSYKNGLKTQKITLKKQIYEAKKSGNDLALKELTRQLDSIKTQKEILELKIEEHKKTFEENDKKIENEMKKEERVASQKNKAQKTISEIIQTKQKLLNDAAKEDFDLPPDIFKEFDVFTSKSEAAFNQKLYEEAINDANRAKNELRNIEKSVEDVKDSTNYKNEEKNKETEIKIGIEENIIKTDSDSDDRKNEKKQENQKEGGDLKKDHIDSFENKKNQKEEKD